MIAAIKKVGLGTAQFGLDYGISNRLGQVPPREIERILRGAQSEGITTIDTAAMFGEAESVLGDLIDDHRRFQVITKTVAVDDDSITPSGLYQVEKGFEKSLLRLKTNSIYGLLVHDVNDFFKPFSERLLELLEKLKSDGRVVKIGASIYTGQQIDGLLDKFKPDLIQVPGSIFDQRLIKSGHIARLHDLGVEIHLRSVLLQGLLVMDPDQLPEYFNPWRAHIDAYRSYLRQMRVSPLTAGLKFGLSLDQVDRVIVGVCSRSELSNLVDAVYDSLPENFDFERWGTDEARLLNPAEWQLIPELV